MAEKLKNYLGPHIVRSIAADLRRAHPSFEHRAFATRCLQGLTELELTPRAWHIADAMDLHLPKPFARAAEVLTRSLGPELTTTDSFGMAIFRYLPHVFFVQKYGLDDFEAAIRLQYELTKRFSAESSIRAFLVRHPEETYARLVEWARDPNPHVRRLVSEGTRPRLPWAPRLRDFQADPAPVLALLELLKDDPDRYVQRSVANNLNDIGKDHPHLAVETCRRWSAEPTAGRRFIVQHALRSLVKKGDREALAALGAGATPKIRITDVACAPSRLRLGATLRFAFTVESTARTEQRLMIDYAVHFVKANGGRRPKVFKLKKVVLPPRGTMHFHDRVSFTDLTTRRHYPGRHRIDAVVNGVAHALAEFDVT